VYFIIDPDFQGGLITACRDDTIHLWNFRQKTPEIVHSVQLQKES
jgi:syntaxin-binding protein 5